MNNYLLRGMLIFFSRIVTYMHQYISDFCNRLIFHPLIKRFFVFRFAIEVGSCVNFSHVSLQLTFKYS